MFSQTCPLGFEAEGAGAICFCEWNGKILLLKRSETATQGGAWTAPGGKLEAGETPLDAAARETFEETGLRLTCAKMIHIGTFYADFSELRYTLDVFKIRFEKDPGKVEISLREHTEYRWVRPAEALKLPLMKGGEACLRAAYAEL